MDDLSPVIEHIADLASKTEGNRWELAEAIHTAFSELPAYSEGLLSGLCERLKYTSTQVYNLRNACEMRAYTGDHGLSVSHMARAFGLYKKYNLRVDEVFDYLKITTDENWSVRQLAQEVQSNHEPDPEGKYNQSISRFITLGRRILNDPLNKLDKSLYANLYDLIKEMEQL